MVDRRPTPTILTFTAKLVSRNRDYALRDFIIAFFVEDSSFMIMERVVRNSGFRGGEFLHRTQADNPSARGAYRPDEVAIGSLVTMSGWTFELTGASEEMLKTMEAKTEIFTRSDLSTLIRGWIDVLKPRAEQLRAAFAERDGKGHGRVPSAGARLILTDYGAQFDPQEWVMVGRRFQSANTGEFVYGDFLAHLG
jgi:hypothetical protein